MDVSNCGSIHEGHEWFSDYTLEEDKRFLCVWLFHCVSNFVDSRTEVPISIKSGLLHEITFFVSVYSAAVKC